MSTVTEAFLHNAPAIRTRSSRQLRMAAERLLWTHLRDGHLVGMRFRRQLLIEDRYLADFACPEAKLAVEVDSDLTPALATHAAERRAFLQSRGYKVLRFSDRDVLIETRAVLAAIRTAVAPASRH
ncbi:MAG: DUF559 domain-containing protein [Burkholderiales bacterium]|nr:DUF559 domain-containing protein [Burkholderiales bacterium]